MKNLLPGAGWGAGSSGGWGGAVNLWRSSLRLDPSSFVDLQTSHPENPVDHVVVNITPWKQNVHWTENPPDHVVKVVKVPHSRETKRFCLNTATYQFPKNPVQVKLLAASLMIFSSSSPLST